MRLNEIQERFKDTLLDGGKGSEDFAALFETGGAATADRLGVYRNNVLKSLTSAVIATYPVIEKLVGKEFMRGMVRQYVMENPPQKGNLNLYGNDFSAFLEQFEAVKELPYLPDIARMEWAWNEACYAPDDAPLDPDALSRVPEGNIEALRFILRASVRLLESDYPLIEIRTLCELGEDAKELDIRAGDIKFMISRPALEVQITPLMSDEYLFLRGLQKGVKLGQVAETILVSHPHFDLGSVLQKHFVLKSFSGFEI